jgi:hypothetical protein
LGNIEERDNECTLGPPHDGESVSNALVFRVALLAQEDVREGLLYVLEVENDPIAFHQHLVDQVSFLGNFEALVASEEVFAVTIDFKIVVDVGSIDLAEDLFLLAHGILRIVRGGQSTVFLLSHLREVLHEDLSFGSLARSCN